MKKNKLSYIILAISTLVTSCSKENTSNIDSNENQYMVTINLPSSRALSDQVQGSGKYSDGETVSLYTTETKFTAEATGSAGGKWLSDNPQSYVTLISGINQDWSVTIKDYYCDVTFDNTSSGGDGTIETVAMKFGEQLPSPTPAAGYTFEGWYDGAIKVTKVPDNPNIAITAKFKLVAQYIIVGDDGYIISPSKVQQVGTVKWNAIAYGNGKYVVVSNEGYITSSTDGINWTTIKIEGTTHRFITHKLKKRIHDKPEGGPLAYYILQHGFDY